MEKQPKENFDLPIDWPDDIPFQPLRPKEHENSEQEVEEIRRDLEKVRKKIVLR